MRGPDTTGIRVKSAVRCSRPILSAIFDCPLRKGGLCGRYRSTRIALLNSLRNARWNTHSLHSTRFASFPWHCLRSESCCVRCRRGSSHRGERPAKPPVLEPLDQAAVDRASATWSPVSEATQQTARPLGDGHGTGRGEGLGGRLHLPGRARARRVRCADDRPGLRTRSPASGARRRTGEHLRGRAGDTLPRSNGRQQRRAVDPDARGAPHLGTDADGRLGVQQTKYTSAESTTLTRGAPEVQSAAGRSAAQSARARGRSACASRRGRHVPTAAAAVSTRRGRGRRRSIHSPAKMKKLPVVHENGSLILEDPKDKGSEPTTGTTDNSNTHFAILGLWAAQARRADRPLVRLARAAVPNESGRNGTWATTTLAAARMGRCR